MTWIAKTNEQMEKTIKIAEEFFSFNDIQINPTKSKLVILNSKKSIKDQKILVGRQEIYPTREEELVRFLGIWIGHKVGKKQIVARAKQISRLFANTIRRKIVSASQVLYINNTCLLPKLEYILQNVFLSREEYGKIQQPYISVAKNKMGLARTIPTYVISHSGILNM